MKKGNHKLIYDMCIFGEYTSQKSFFFFDPTTPIGACPHFINCNDHEVILNYIKYHINCFLLLFLNSSGVNLPHPPSSPEPLAIYFFCVSCKKTYRPWKGFAQCTLNIYQSLFAQSSERTLFRKPVVSDNYLLYCIRWKIHETSQINPIFSLRLP